MRNLSKNFENREINYSKLLEYGFVKEKNSYIYEKDIVEKHFKVIMEISEDKQISKVIDTLTNEEYILADVQDSSGDFVGKVKDAYNLVINNVINKCTNSNIFKSEQTKEIIKYIKEKYHDDLEFLWEKFPTDAIWRNKQNKKWYGLILTIDENKLGIKGNKKVEIIDLRYPKEDIKNIVDNKKIFPGYHMNKNSWLTIKLDGSVTSKEIYKLIDISYELSLSKKYFWYWFI